MTEKKLKAYVVREDDEGNCAITFATNGATARRRGANELNMSFDEVESCRREPAFDQYAPGPVPLHATLAAGWWHECNHCGVRFDKDERNHGDDGDREDAFEPVQDGQHANYCSPACMMGHWAELRARQAREHAVIEACALRWPGASNIRAYERYFSRDRESRWVASFSVPGVNFQVEWESGQAHVLVSQCDVEAFKLWANINKQ